MSQEIKDWMHYGSAIGMLISCVVLTFISFLTLHLVHSTVLMYVTLCITFVIIALKQYRLYHSNDTASLAWLQVSLFTWLAIPV